MKKPMVDFVIVIDELRREGKKKASPVSRDANSFNCPKCGSLISPENPKSNSELDFEKSKGALVQCKHCKTIIQLLWQTDPSRSICEKFKKSK